MRRALRLALLATFIPSFIGAVASDAAAQPACTAPKTTCAGANGYYASREDLDRLTAVADPLLRELRTCLDAAGGKHVHPAAEIRWDSEGHPVAVKIEAPGYESLPCVAKASGKLSQLQNPRETAIRCDYGCAKPVAPAPPPPLPTPPPPVVFQPPGQQPPPQPAPATGGVVVVPPAPARIAEQPAVRTEKIWYGWQVLIMDGIAFSLTLAGGFSSQRGVLTAGLVTFGLGAPIVHMAHVHIGRGFGSIGLRVLLPLVGAGIGAIAGLAANGSNNATVSQSAGDAAGTGAIVGAFVGGAGCTLIDAVAIGYTTEKVEPGITRGPGQPGSPSRVASTAPIVSLVPIIDLQRGSIGVGGRF